MYMYTHIHTLQHDNAESLCQNLLDSPFDEMSAAHIRYIRYTCTCIYHIRIYMYISYYDVHVHTVHVPY